MQATDKDGNDVTDARGQPRVREEQGRDLRLRPQHRPRARARLPGTSTASRDNAQVPVDAVTASGSGLDPDISIANADLQAARVAKARNLPVAQVMALIHSHIHQRSLGFLGEKTVNVLDLNVALNAIH